jgi:micrococcal nuclease
MLKKIVLIFILLFSFNIVYAEEVTFYKCVDGDTFKIKKDDEIIVVRMLSIDTPESVKDEGKVEYYGAESSKYVCRELKLARKLELEYDPKSDKTDKYGRHLAWVFTDGELLQEKLVSGGYAKVAYLYADYKYNDLLKEKEAEAKDKGIGVWNTEEEEKYNNLNEDAGDIDVVLISLLFLAIALLFKFIIRK